MDPVSAAEIALRNPFEAQAGREEAERAVGEATPSVVAELARRSRPKEARRVAVAIVHRELATRGESSLPGRLLTDIGLTARAVLDVAAGAVRCAAALRSLAGDSAAMQRVRAAAWRACFGDSIYEALSLRPLVRQQNVLILGETGTGKELVARAIAAADPDPARAQSINAAAIPRDLLEAELFGHTRGAFSGAAAEREGKIVAASGATLFLDEIYDLPLELAAKMLRVIEDGQVTPLGSNQPRKVDVRWVTATSQPLRAAVERGDFRRDLYERLAGITLVIPSLRERPEDLRPIAEALFVRYGQQLGGAAVGASSTHMSRLSITQARFLAWLAGPEAAARPWHGNVRELGSVMRSWILGFEDAGAPRDAGPPSSGPLQRFLDAEASLRELEDWYILHVMEKVGYHQRRAAEILGVDRGTLTRRLRQIESSD